MDFLVDKIRFSHSFNKWSSYLMGKLRQYVGDMNRYWVHVKAEPMGLVDGLEIENKRVKRMRLISETQDEELGK